MSIQKSVLLVVITAAKIAVKKSVLGVVASVLRSVLVVAVCAAKFFV